MRKICLFHFSPLELFPPVMNMINYLEEELPDNYLIRVYSTHYKKNVLQFKTKKGKVRIIRYGRYDVRQSAAERYQLYVQYNAGVFFSALAWRPHDVLYYETFSALPAIWLKKIRKKLRIFIHYHEYVSPAEYNAIPTLKYIHRLEKKIYDKSVWISHTNEDRAKLFASDVSLQDQRLLHSLPNYPPSKWRAGSGKKLLTYPVRIVYVGAMGMNNLYIKEFAYWVEQQEGKVTWDIFSQNNLGEMEEFLRSIHSRFIQVRGFVAYSNLPDVLKEYDVGVILYKGIVDNTIYSASNKLFEYLACGLDVWFPEEIKGSYDYIKKESYPKVLCLSFTTLGQLKPEELFSRERLPYVPSSYYCEDQYRSLKNILLQ